MGNRGCLEALAGGQALMAAAAGRRIATVFATSEAGDSRSGEAVDASQPHWSAAS